VAGEIIADEQHTVRHCDSKWFYDGDSISSSNFLLRRKDNSIEEYLSVGWLESYSDSPRAAQIAAYRDVIHPNIRKFKTTDKLAVLNVGQTRANISAGTADSRAIDFRHWPSTEPRKEDVGHAGIHNTADNETKISELLLESVMEEYPAR
jgi:hypothetical protein